MNYRSIIFGFFSLTLLAGCGGGSGGGDPSTATLRFETDDFAGKSHYLVSAADGIPTYALAAFNADGTGMASPAVQSGIPTANDPFIWAVEDGELKVTDDGEIITIALLNDDSVNRYYTVRVSIPEGSSEAGILYDQVTGLAQAQQFVEDNGGIDPGYSSGGSSPATSGGVESNPESTDGSGGYDLPSACAEAC